jgi:hypothetical protein
VKLGAQRLENPRLVHGVLLRPEKREDSFLVALDSWTRNGISQILSEMFDPGTFAFASCRDAYFVSRRPCPTVPAEFPAQTPSTGRYSPEQLFYRTDEVSRVPRASRLPSRRACHGDNVNT